MEYGVSIQNWIHKGRTWKGDNSEHQAKLTKDIVAAARRILTKRSSNCSKNNCQRDLPVNVCVCVYEENKSILPSLTTTIMILERERERKRESTKKLTC